MKLRVRSPRRLAGNLLRAARRHRQQVEEYLDARPAEWEALVESAPGDAADVLEELSEEAAIDLLVDLHPESAADLLEEITPELAADLLEEMPIGTVAAALDMMDPEDAADLIGELDEQAAADVLEAMGDEEAEAVRRLLVYPPDSAGGLMTQEVASLPMGLTIGEAVERIRQLNDELDDLSYVYVVDDDGRLRGVISFRDLVFGRPGNGLDEAMVADPVAVTAFADRAEVAELAQRYHLFGVPVTDESGRLLGMVTSDAVLEAVQEEASEDFAAAVGAGREETVYSEVLRSVRMRSPWLLLNLCLALVVALVVEQLTGIVSREPVLAALMPVVATLGGNSGQQSLAVMIRSLGLDNVPSSRVASILGRQVRVGLLNGILVASAASSLAMFLVASGVFRTGTQPHRIGMAVALAVIFNLTLASVAGTGIPLVARRLGQDPAVASTIFLTLITDTVGFGGFLFIAGLLV